ncbi:patatin-like phospholipase domain-containing protein 5 [Cricetulus griseus]|nr:patatin-like phospholipase domain-containing protein 5 [Cricetulus griseus]
MVKQVEHLSLGIFHPAYNPIEHIRKKMEDFLPENCHILASQRLGISMTRWYDGQNTIVTDFATRDELIQRYIDGALSNNLPFSDSPTTITVSPFHGTVDICPQSSSSSLYELTAFNASFQVSTRNFFQGIISLFPPKPEVVADYCRQGYLDALRFLERRGLTKEPVLWSLVSKDSPELIEEPRSADHDQGQKLSLTIRWDIPNVLVKDVSNFELLSPELEAALKKACKRDFWARLQCSVPGRALTYLLLPCTLPFEYVYFRSRRRTYIVSLARL